MTICNRCMQRYEGAECPHCRERTVWERLGGYFLLALLLLGVGLISLCVQGCSSAGTRKALVGSAEAVKETANGMPPIVCGLVEKGCKTNPCPALEKCKKATRLIRSGAALYIQGCSLLNEVVPNE